MTKEQTMSALRTRMIEDMQLAGLSATTQKVYLQAVTALVKHYRNRSPDHRLAPSRGAAGRRPRRLWRAEKPLRLGQGQWRDGLALSEPARARLCVQKRPRVAPQ